MREIPTRFADLEWAPARGDGRRRARMTLTSGLLADIREEAAVGDAMPLYMVYVTGGDGGALSEDRPPSTTYQTRSHMTEEECFAFFAEVEAAGL
jgi:hypothetical protein